MPLSKAKSTGDIYDPPQQQTDEIRIDAPKLTRTHSENEVSSTNDSVRCKTDLRFIFCIVSMITANQTYQGF